jgi:biotin-dependent carboxylase-like uncharacterized protein
MKVCRVIQPGILSTIQDTGRRGHYSQGIPESGAFDSFAFRLGNHLLQNSYQAAGIEVLLGGFCVEFLETTWIAITGGDLGAKIDGQPVPMWETVQVNPGQRLFFAARQKGLRTYLLFSGGLDVPCFLDSRSTYLFLKKGGFHGRKLEAGDLLETFPHPERRVACRVRTELRPLYRSPWQLRIVYGLQDKRFTESSLKRFESSTWTVTSEADRVGVRLKGFPLKFKTSVGPPLKKLGGIEPSNIATEGNPLGSIQFPGEDQIIIIGPDGPCEGGYVKLGTIISADFYLLGQVMPGDQVKFKSVTLDEAYQELYRQKRIGEEFDALEKG